MKAILFNISCGVTFILMVASCGVDKYIPMNEVLYDGAQIQTVFPERYSKSKMVQQELQTVVGPAPNSKFLGMRLGLRYHFKAQKKNPGFLNKWLNKKFGEEPVYLSDVNRSRIEGLMLNRLDNRGFFYSTVTSEIDSSGNAASILYQATISEPYLLEELKLNTDSLPILKDIAHTLETTSIKKGSRFDLELLKYERERIDGLLKKKGYYNFNPDFLIFEADTNQYDSRKFNLQLRLKTNVPKKSLARYVLDSITVYPNYSITNDTNQINQLSVEYDGINFVQEKQFFKPKRLAPYILFKKGQYYNPETARLTSNRLSALGSYKFVNIRFSEKDTLPAKGDRLLATAITLSPLTKRALRAEFQAITKSNGFAGPGVALTYSNRNLFKGGESLSISGTFAYEAQLSGGQNTGLSSISGGLQVNLILPRLVPFSPSRFHYAVPKTKIGLSGDILKRSQLYTLTSANGVFGYNWNANRFVFHELNPISITYVDLANTTDAFNTILAENPFLRQSFEQQFIAGLNYSFTYNELVDKNKKNPIFIATSLDIAGNTISLLSDEKGTVLGQQYAQYAKADFDFRYYFKWGKEQALVSRLYAGWGVPYGNSTTLPFVKQFFSGGPYSVRAFQIRSLGPGSFRSDRDNTSSFFDQSGNLRLEANLEYRFPIWSFLKGAVFLDAGNVWLTNSFTATENEPQENIDFNTRLFAEGKFESDWAKELGVGLGVGLRFDIQSFVIRFDLASPWRIPYLPENERSRTPFFDGGSQNLVLNFAIGYPF